MRQLFDEEREKAREMRFVCKNFLFSLMTMRKCIFEFKFIDFAEMIDVFFVRKTIFSLMIFNLISSSMHDFTDKMSDIFL